MNRKPQNFSNHARLVPLYHLVTFAAMLILLAGTVYLLITNKENSLLLPLLILLLVLTVISISLHCRSFALKAQDRAIRAEENLRYFILTGKRLNQSLNIRQVIALRFADDQEFPELAERAARENLPPKTIKKEIRNWRPDYHRA
jgi:hypothetical protein